MDKVIELMNWYIEIGYKETLEMMKDGWKMSHRLLNGATQVNRVTRLKEY